MTRNDLARAMKCCPFGKTACIFVDLGACTVVHMWQYDHKSVGVMQTVHFQPGDVIARGKRGGAATALRRKVHAVI